MADDEYRQARADEKAARARARALRPWYKKKRFILGIPLAIIVVLAIAGAVVGGGGDEDSGGGDTAASDADGTVVSSTDGPAKVGDLVRVGSLDLTITGVETGFDATQYNMFNDSNVAVHFTATNERGDDGQEYDFILNSFKLVDASGVAHPASICAGCPGEFQTKSLVRGGSMEATVYFTAPEGTVLKELLYEPLFSTNKARISLE